jgi:hypothetical protein
MDQEIVRGELPQIRLAVGVSVELCVTQGAAEVINFLGRGED